MSRTASVLIASVLLIAAATANAASMCDSSKELSVIVSYVDAAYGPMWSGLECVNLKTGALRVALNITEQSNGQLIGTGSPFTPTYGSSMNYINGVAMAPFALMNVPGGFYNAVPAAVDDGDLIWANFSYGYDLQPDEMLLFQKKNADGSSSFEAIGAVTFAPSESDPFAKHLFRYSSIDSDAAPEWFVNVSTPVGGFFVGFCAAIDQKNGIYHFVATDTQSAELWSVSLTPPYKATSAPTNDYGPEMTSLTWNPTDGKLYAVAQTDEWTVAVLTVDAKTGAADVLSSLSLTDNGGLSFQSPAAFNFDSQTVTLVVSYETNSTAKGAGAACATNAVYTYKFNGDAVSHADIQVPSEYPCDWTPVTMDFEHKF